jgi:hypothetical protein
MASGAGGYESFTNPAGSPGFDLRGLFVNSPRERAGARASARQGRRRPAIAELSGPTRTPPGAVRAPRSRGTGVDEQALKQSGAIQSVLWVLGSCPGTSPFQNVFATA